MAARKPIKVKIGSDTRGFKRGMKDSERALRRFTKSAKQSFRRIGLAAGAGMAAGVAAAGSFVRDMDNARAAIGRATGATGEELQAQFKAFQEAAKNLPEASADVAAAFGDLRTFATGTNAQIATLTEQMADFARVSGGDVQTTTKQLGAVLNTFGGEASTLSAAMDTLTAVTQDFGIPAEVLGKFMRDFGQLFQVAGFSIDETSVFLGQLHKQGIKVSRIGPAINKFLRDMAAQGKNGRVELQNLVLELRELEKTGGEGAALKRATDALGAEGAVRFVSAVRNGLDITDEALADFVSKAGGRLDESVAATTTFGERLREIMNKLKVSIGSALLPVLDRLGRWIEGNWDHWVAQARELFWAVQDIGRAVGRELSPYVTTLAHWFGIVKDKFKEWYDKIREWIDSNPERAMLIFQGAVAALAGAFAAFTAAKFIGVIRTVSLVLTGAAAALAGPLGLIALIGALAAGAVWAYNNIEPFRDAVDSLWKRLKKFGEWWSDSSWWERFTQFPSAIKDLFEDMSGLEVAIVAVTTALGALSFWKLAGSIAGLFAALGPAGWLILGLAAIAGSFALLYTQVPAVRDYFNDLVSDFKDAFTWDKDEGWVERIEDFGEAFENLNVNIGGAEVGFGTFVTSWTDAVIWKKDESWVERLWDLSSAFSGLDTGVAGFKVTWEGLKWLHWDLPKWVAEQVWDATTNLLDVAGEGLSALGGIIVDGFTGPIRDFFVNIWHTIYEWVVGEEPPLEGSAGHKAGQFIGRGISRALEALILDLPRWMGEQVVRIITGLWEVGWKLANLIWVGATAAVKFALTELPGKMIDFIGQVLLTYRAVGSFLFHKIIPGIWAALKWMVTELPGRLWGWLTEVASQLQDFGEGLASEIYEGFKRIVFSIPIVGDVAEFVHDTGGKVDDFLTNNPVGQKVDEMTPWDGVIPFIGSGGIVKRPTLAVVGEAGPEAVVPLKGLQHDIAPLPSMMSGGTTGGGITINVYGDVLDDARLGQVVYDALRTRQRLNGPIDIDLRTAS